MLFNKKKCPNCKSEYDVVDATCPVCLSVNDDVEKLRINQNIVWLPWVRQLIVFLIGALGLQIAAIVLSLIVGATMGNGLDARLTLNFTAYVVTILALLGGFFPFYKRLLT